MVAEEIRFVVGRKITAGEWTARPALRLLLEALADAAREVEVSSLTELDLEQWLPLVRKYRPVKGRDWENYASLLRSFFKTLNRALVMDPWSEDDWLWTDMFDELLGSPGGRAKSNLNWSLVQQRWLREHSSSTPASAFRRTDERGAP
jgi:hypothetical protein